MNAEPTDDHLKPSADSEGQTSDPRPSDDRHRQEGVGDPSRQATVLVRGETIREPQSKSQDASTSKDGKEDAPRGKDKPDKALSKEKVEAQSRLPALGDDADIGVDKAQIITRDGGPDLAFTGTLIASAAPATAPKGQWQEYRIYETDAGKHVFSKITRKVLAEEQDSHQAKVFDPSPSSMPARLLKSAHDITHSRPLEWTDAAVDFFGYDPLAKDLYKKFGTLFEERVS